MNRIKKSVMAKYAGLMSLMTAFMVAMTTNAYADKIADAAKGAAEGIQATAMGAAKYLIIIVLVVAGVIFLVGSQRAKENQKETAWEKIAGVALIVCAVPIAGIIFGWFN